MLNLIPDIFLSKYAMSIPVISSGLVNVDNYKILADSVYSSDYFNAKISSVVMIGRIIDSNSIYYATNRSPVYIYNNGTLYIYANGGTIEGNASAITYPSILFGDASVSNYPLSLVPAVILYASIQATIQNINSKILLIDNLSFNFPVVPSTPVTPNFNYNSVTDPTISSTIITPVTPIPAYTPPTFGGSYANIDTRLTVNDDYEIAHGYIEEINSQLNQYAEDIQNSYHQYEADNTVYQTTLQINIEQARLTQQRLIEISQETTSIELQNASKELEADIAEYSATLQLFQTNFSIYSIQVDEEVKRVTTYISKYVEEINSLNGLLKSLQDEYASIIKNFISNN